MIRERAVKHTIYVEIIKSISAGGKHGTYGKTTTLSITSVYAKEST